MTIRFLPLDIYKRHLSLPVRKKCPIHNLPPFTDDYILFSHKRVKFSYGTCIYLDPHKELTRFAWSKHCKNVGLV